MSSYLRILAARALDQPQPIRPRLPALFESPSGPTVLPVETARRRVPDSQKNNRSEVLDVPARREADPPTISLRGRLSDAIRLSPSRTRQISEDRNQRQEIETNLPREHANPVVGSAAPAKPVERDVISGESARPGPITLESPNQIAEPIRPADQSSPSENGREIRRAEITEIQNTLMIESNNEPVLPPARASDLERPRAEPLREQPVVVKPDISPGNTHSLRLKPESSIEERPSSIRITIGRVDVRAILPAAQTSTLGAPKPAIKAMSLDEYLKTRNGAKN